MYHGGKSRQAPYIGRAIRAAAQGRTRYLEPFVGGGNILITTPPTWDRTATDIHPDLILLWQAIQNGWTPPTTITRDAYERLRHTEPSALRGFSGFACSWGSKWFGGYGVNGRNLNLAEASSRWLAKHRHHIQGVHFDRCDYRDHNPGPDTVVYCDPPYRSTTGYLHGFDHDTFWHTMNQWVANGAAVLVSEFAAPADWIHTRTRSRYISEDRTTRTEEHLWRHHHEHQPALGGHP